MHGAWGLRLETADGCYNRGSLLPERSQLNPLGLRLQHEMTELAAAGVGIGAANFAAAAPGHAKTWNHAWHSVIRFRTRVRDVELELNGCKSILEDWIGKWKYHYYGEDERYRDAVYNFLRGHQPASDTPNDRGRYSLEVYRSLWSNDYPTINELWSRVLDEIKQINVHIEKVLNKKKRDPKWLKYLNVPRQRYLRNVTFALFSESSLTDEITMLKKHLGELKEASERRIDAISAADCKLTGPIAFQLANLDYFGRKFLPEMRTKMPTTSAWSLELCHPDIGGSAKVWEGDQGIDWIQVWLSFTLANDPQGARHRIALHYVLAEYPEPPSWETPLVHPIPDGLNPRWYGNGVLRRQTESFTHLFRRRLFEDDTVKVVWALEQAYLVLALVNWSALLWTSDWSTDWCCSGLRFMQSEFDAASVGRKSSFLPSFSRCVRHVEHADTSHQQQPHQHQQGDLTDCLHREQKLWNLGLALAEVLCAKSFRGSHLSNTMYEEFTTEGWKPISQDRLLEMVDECTKGSGTDPIKQAVNHCLISTARPGNTADGMAGFYKTYIDKVFTP
jgi:hypothetical protein